MLKNGFFSRFSIFMRNPEKKMKYILWKITEKKSSFFSAWLFLFSFGFFLFCFVSLLPETGSGGIAGKKSFSFLREDYPKPDPENRNTLQNVLYSSTATEKRDREIFFEYGVVRDRKNDVVPVVRISLTFETGQYVLEVFPDLLSCSCPERAGPGIS